MRASTQYALTLLAASDWRGAVAELGAGADVEDSAVLGMAYLAAENWGAAYSTLRRAMALGDDTPATQINLALAEDRMGLDGRARMRALARHLPDWEEPPIRLGDSHRRGGAFDLAIPYYEQALALNPDRVEALLSLGVLLIGAGGAERAQVLLRHCCGLSPSLADAWDALGIAHLKAGEAALAEAAFAEAQRLRPDNVEIALRRTEAAMAAGTHVAELARLEAATAADPLDVAQLTARGALLDWLGRPDDAIDVLETVVALEPDSRNALAALAASQIRGGHFQLALPTLRRAVEVAPGDFNLRNDLAATLNRMHRYREGREILETLIVEHGERTPLLCNLSNALVSLGLQAEGVAMARRATEIAPLDHTSWRTLATAMSYCDGIPAAESLAAWRQTGATAGRAEPLDRPRPSGPDRRLRVGLLSTALRTHPVGWLTIAAFEALDPAAFELVGFGPAPSEDALQRRFRAATAEWHTIIGRPAPVIADMVRQAGIDILIDLGGWGDQGTLGACARRPAPLQVKWVGSQSHTTGLAEIDWFISDRWETPAGSDALYTECLLRMPDGYVCYAPPAYAPAVAPPPADAAGRVTFGCFNNLAKITPPTVAVWSAILARIPGARLLLKTHQFSDPPTAALVRDRFAAHGIDPARIELRGSSSHRGQLAQHADVDIVLDPFPYSGGLTTCEALWMGVPVVTLAGDSFAARHSTSHLGNVGLDDWVGGDHAAYQDIAIAAATDLPRLRALRATLRARLHASPLCDASRFAVHLGAALRGIWQEACGR